MTEVITLVLASGWVFIQECFVSNRGKNYKLQKLHYPLEQDYGLKKIS